MKPKLCIPDPVLFGHRFPLNIIICDDVLNFGNVVYKLFIVYHKKTNICDLSEGDGKNCLKVFVLLSMTSVV